MTPETLKAWRTARNLSQAKAAEQLGVSERSLVTYEKPGGTVPRVVQLAILGLRAKEEAVVAAQHLRSLEAKSHG